MRATGFRRLCGLLLALPLAGCVGDGGGRGSSGFDITENLLITRMLEMQACLSQGDVTFCPADQTGAATTPTPTPVEPTVAVTATPTPTALPAPRVDTGLAHGISVACTREHLNAPCELTFSFLPTGFAPETAYSVAARLRSPDGDWILTAPQALDAGDGATLHTALIRLPLPASPHPPRVQFAVLAFITPPGALPTRVPVVAQTRTDFAFITQEFALEVITTGPPPVTATATATRSPSVTPSIPETPATATPTATATPPRVGPEITYFGVARADSAPLAPSGVDGAGRPIYIRPFGSGFSLVVEARAGGSGRPPGRAAFVNTGDLPDLQLILSRPLGDGSPAVCDGGAPQPGGVPGVVPFAFADAPEVRAAINDLGCRVDDGRGNPAGRLSAEACTMDRGGEFAFVQPNSAIQFCLPIAAAWSFPAGDTIVAARVRDTGGMLGPEREIVVRSLVSPFSPPTHTPRPRSTATRTGTVTASPTSTPIPMSPSASPTATLTRTPTPTLIPGEGPEITHLGLARADDRPLMPSDTDALGRPVYAVRVTQAVVLLVEARPGTSQRSVGRSGYEPDGLPDLQVIVSRPLGDGSPVVCDAEPPLFGGVPATVPLVFSGDPGVMDAINDLGCRADDGTGLPFARASSQLACTRDDSTATGFGFVNAESTVQFCIPIAQPWRFNVGDTVIVARARDVAGNFGAARTIVVRARR